ncbi:hypothetical protein SFC42_15715 [Priestia filamentosa]|uniref:hypothetical protein n=1 Tax=Priestia filamentosa TaxID=1402861 RepID=UPI0039837042
MKMESAISRIQQARSKNAVELLIQAIEELNLIDACVEEIDEKKGEYMIITLSGKSIVVMTALFTPDSPNSKNILQVHAYPLKSLESFIIEFHQPNLIESLVRNDRKFTLNLIDRSVGVHIKKDDPRTDDLNHLINSIKNIIS